MEGRVEHVVLVDESDVVLGTFPKKKVHGSETPLHRAFSLFLFNPGKQLLLQQRAGSKKTWPMVWSNSCCGHPLPGESYEGAVIRRTLFELGIRLEKVIKISDYRYCFSKDGVMENEVCPIFTAVFDGNAQPNPTEIEAIQWIDWADWVAQTIDFPNRFSPWCVEETRIMTQKQSWKKAVKKHLCH